MRIEAILFDIEGTWSTAMLTTSWPTKKLPTIGERFSRKQIHDQIGKGSDMLVIPATDENLEFSRGEFQVFVSRLPPAGTGRSLACSFKQKDLSWTRNPHHRRKTRLNRPSKIEK